MPAELRLNLLGNVAIALGSESLTPMRSRSAEALLIYLALNRQTFSRQVLADFFWDERSQKQALSNLRTVLTILRRQLPDHLLITRHTVAFNHGAPHWIDANAFLQSPLPAPQSPISNLQSPIAILQSTLSFYHGDFLAGFSLPEAHGFETWTLIVREQVNQTVAAMLHRLADHFQGHYQYESALPYARRLLHLNPLDDLAQRRVMELLWRSGQRNAALEQYVTSRRLLAQELCVEPDSATTTLFERLRDAPFPPPCHVPASPTSFVGREEEVAQVSTLLGHPQVRIITILGPGGMGKTRLLLETARHLGVSASGRFMDGIFFIPLAGLPSPEFLPTTLAQHVGLGLQGPAEPFEELLDYLRPREMLLALDNIEHLLTGQSRRWLARIAREAPGVCLLTSSRARLALQGEHILQLQGLSPPAALRLFTARATAVQPRFEPDAAGIQAIARLCRLVDGMPLALELAAAGARHRTCGEIVAEVRARLDWQFDHFPDRPRRHQNLQAVFEHSWALLRADEQDIARRLSVFAGPFNGEGARIVAGATPEVLATLNDQSLLVDEEPGWFDLHPLVRRFLAEKLAADRALGQETARRHVEYIVQLRAITGGDSNMESRFHDIRRVMARQREQVIAAALWLARQRDFSGRKLVSLVEGLIFYYKHSAQFANWKVTFGQLLQALAQGEGEEEQARWLSAVLRSRRAEADLEMHAYECAQDQFEELLPQALNIENGPLISYCYHMLGRLATRRADFEAAYRYLKAALPPLEMPPYGAQYVFPVYRSWTEAALLAGDLQMARDCAEKAYALALQVDSQLEAEPIYAWALGEIAYLEGAHLQARRHLQRAVQRARDKGYWVDQVRASISLATVLAVLGEGANAAPMAAGAYDMAVARHDRRLMALAARARGRAAECLGERLAAHSFYRHSLVLLDRIGDQAELCTTQRCLDALS